MTLFKDLVCVCEYVNSKKLEKNTLNVCLSGLRNVKMNSKRRLTKLISLNPIWLYGTET